MAPLSPLEAGGGATPLFPYPIENGIELSSQKMYNASAGTVPQQFTFHIGLKPTSNTKMTLYSVGGGTYNTRAQIWWDGTINMFRLYDYNCLSAYTPALDWVLGEHVWLTFAIDGSKATGAEGCKVYVNGVEQVLNVATWNPGKVFDFLRRARTLFYDQSRGQAYMDGIVSDYHCVEGQFLDPTSFGEVSTKYPGLFIPKPADVIDYGTAGFHLDFNDPADLGKDVSGKGNHFSVTGSPIPTTDTPTNIEI